MGKAYKYSIFNFLVEVRDGHDFDFKNQNHDFKIKIMILKSNHDLIFILNHLIFSDFDFDFKSSEISMILILKRIKNQNHFMISYYN